MKKISYKKMIREYQKKITNCSEDNATFIELLERNDEFVFQYGKTKYEIVYEDLYDNAIYLLCLYLSDNGTFLQSFRDKDDFLENGQIDGKFIKEIIDEIKV